jgi:TolB-like protein
MTKSPAKNHFLKNLFTILFFCFLAVSLGSCSGGGGGGSSPTPSTTYWAKTYGGANDDVAYSIHQTSDGGFIVAGGTHSFTTVNGDVWVLKLDANGNIQWQKIYGGNGVDVARSIQQTSDGGFIVAGETFVGNTDIWIMKLYSNGTIQWQNRYGGTGDDIAHSIRQTSDGNFLIVAGETTSFGLVSSDFWVLKLNANDGSIVWEQRYGGNGAEVARSILETSDRNFFIVAGETTSFGAGGTNIWLLKLNANDGNIIAWQKTYGKIDTDNGVNDIQQTSDGGYILAGGTTNIGSNVQNFLVLKLDSDGVVVWGEQYGRSNDDIAYSVRQTSEGGYIIAGGTTPVGSITKDIWIIKLAANGSIEWQKTYDGTYDDVAYSIQQISDGGFIVVGVTTSFGAGNADFWVLKLDGNGNIGSGCSVIGTSSATVSSTGITAVDSSGTVNNTNATVTQTSVTPQDSTALIATQCSSP